MQSIRMNRAGTSVPVFLCPKVEAHRFYVDVSAGAEVSLQLSYERAGAKNRTWETYPVGKLTSDFAFEEFGVSAVRLCVVKKAEGNIDVQLVIEDS